MTAPTETIRIRGLGAEAEIVVDRWGVAHCYAASERDAFFVQGFNAARDRLWQIDLWRKRGLGLMAGDFGPAYLERDRAARLLLYRGDMAAEWAAYGPEAARRTAAFTAGINAYVELTEREPGRLAPEFRIMGTQPARWAPEDPIRCRAHARVRNLDMEVTRATIVARHGLGPDGLHRGLMPAWRTRVPEGLVPHEIPAEVMRTYNLATEPLALALGEPAQPFAAEEGSNNWALAPGRTATGRPILASDPHRVHEQPSLRYMVHLVAPGIDVIGAGEPAVPGVSLGHNDRIAFGLTIFPTDQEDLYVYELHPDDPDLYRYDGGWERMRTVVETIPVRGGPDREAALRFTRHGPVLHVDAVARRAYAVRTVWTEPGTAAYMASLRYITARNAAEYLEALAHWGAPSTNHVVADVDGRIAWCTAAKLPVRPNWDGLMPVPGDGRYEWAGFLEHREHPRLLDPARGWVASANQMNLPPDFDHRRHKTGFEWSDRVRYDRVAEVLASVSRHTIEDSIALQTDYLSLPARRLSALVAQLAPETPEAAKAKALLAGWDHRLEAGSAAAALFEIWFAKHLIRGVIRRLGPPDLSGLIATPDTELLLGLVERADPRFGPAPVPARDRLLAKTLAAAWIEAETLMGPDPAAWAWGRLHKGYFEHGLSRFAPPAARARLDVGPAPKGGSGLTVNNNGYRTSDFRIVSGVSWRMIVDVGNWDASLWINAPGQSGDPRSPHYRDLFERWAEDAYVPMAYSRAAVEAAAERRIRLAPG